uniref:Uncharacterized protein n=1 Tax=Fusarium oxysporum (strain Fo5176) TaxID=660025 RepID=A0A0C4BKX4_FUSOF
MSTSSRSPGDSGVRKTQPKSSLAKRSNALAQYLVRIVPRGAWTVAYLFAKNAKYMLSRRNPDMGEWLPDVTNDLSQSPFVSDRDTRQSNRTNAAASPSAPRPSTRPKASCPLTVRSIETDSSLSSSATFGARVQNLVSQARHTRETPQPTPTGFISSNDRPSPGQAYGVCQSDFSMLPSESEAYRLLDIIQDASWNARQHGSCA